MKKKIKIGLVSLLLVVGIFSVSSMAFAQSSCTTPLDGMTITEDTIFCEGTYDLPNGLSIGADEVILDCNGAVIDGGLTMVNNYGIYAENRKEVTVKNCELKNYMDGIYLIGTDNSNITNNTVDNSNKMFSHPNDGIHFMESHNNLISNNYLTGSNGHGIELMDSNDNTIEQNTVIGNENGISLCKMGIIGCDKNTIVQNIVKDNSNGIIVSAFGGCGYTYDNYIYMNDIVESSNRIAINFGDNFWDKDSIGNYWGFCVKADVDGDGICDAPYVFKGGQDNYPSVYPFLIEKPSAVTVRTNRVPEEMITRANQYLILLVGQAYFDAHIGGPIMDSVTGKTTIEYSIEYNLGGFFDVYYNDRHIEDSFSISTSIVLVKLDQKGNVLEYRGPTKPYNFSISKEQAMNLAQKAGLKQPTGAEIVFGKDHEINEGYIWDVWTDAFLDEGELEIVYLDVDTGKVMATKEAFHTERKLYEDFSSPTFKISKEQAIEIAKKQGLKGGDVTYEKDGKTYTKNLISAEIGMGSLYDINKGDIWVVFTDAFLEQENDIYAVIIDVDSGDVLKTIEFGKATRGLTENRNTYNLIKENSKFILYFGIVIFICGLVFVIWRFKLKKKQI